MWVLSTPWGQHRVDAVGRQIKRKRRKRRGARSACGRDWHASVRLPSVTVQRRRASLARRCKRAVNKNIVQRRCGRNTERERRGEERGSYLISCATLSFSLSFPLPLHITVAASPSLLDTRLSNHHLSSLIRLKMRCASFSLFPSLASPSPRFALCPSHRVGHNAHARAGSICDSVAFAVPGCALRRRVAGCRNQHHRGLWLSGSAAK